MFSLQAPFDAVVDSCCGHGVSPEQDTLTFQPDFPSPVPFDKFPAFEQRPSLLETGFRDRSTRRLKDLAYDVSCDDDAGDSTL
jgi:hypothetical protein